MPKYECLVTVQWIGNKKEAENIDHYIALIKEDFKNAHDVDLEEKEITQITQLPDAENGRERP